MEEKTTNPGEWIDERPFFMSWDKKTEKWVLNILDPKTREVVEQRINMNGYWRKVTGRR